MFSLIITIISIALVAALALATLYYGGTAFNKGSSGATAARLINEGQQINGAVQILKADRAAGAVDGTDPTKVSGLAPKYLSQLPAGWDAATTDIATGVILTTNAVAADVCTEVNKRASLTGTVTTTSAVYGCDSVSGKVFYNF